jgi:hypothetical protein
LLDRPISMQPVEEPPEVTAAAQRTTLASIRQWMNEDGGGLSIARVRSKVASMVRKGFVHRVGKGSRVEPYRYWQNSPFGSTTAWPSSGPQEGPTS